jgi:hypothetical protein
LYSDLQQLLINYYLQNQSWNLCIRCWINSCISYESTLNLPFTKIVSTFFLFWAAKAIVSSVLKTRLLRLATASLVTVVLVPSNCYWNMGYFTEYTISE